MTKMFILPCMGCCPRKYNYVLVSLIFHYYRIVTINIYQLIWYNSIFISFFELCKNLRNKRNVMYACLMNCFFVWIRFSLICFWALLVCVCVCVCACVRVCVRACVWLLSVSVRLLFWCVGRYAFRPVSTTEMVAEVSSEDEMTEKILLGQ